MIASLALLLLSGCAPRVPAAAPETPASSPTAFPSSTPTVVLPTEAPLLPSPTPEILIEPVSNLEALVPTVAAPEPLRFVFPTPGPEPVSAWRPPLYPVPWAPTPYDHFYFSRPIAADQVNWPLAEYRYGGNFFENVVHTGVDIPAQVGTQVLAAGSGKVVWAGYGLYALKEDLNDPYGLAVAVKHDFGYQAEPIYTVYGHMSQIFVTRGQRVETGDLIGLVGETGKVTGPHLHFEVRLGKNNFFGSRNPELWMAPPEGWGVLAARIMATSGELLPQQLIKIHNLDTGQYWAVKSYGKGPVNSDSYYQENMVIGDLPAGNYEIWIPYQGSVFDLNVKIQPGLVSYFTFRGMRGFKIDLPEYPGSDFLPAEIAPTPTP